MRLRSSAALLVLLWAVGCGAEESTFTEDYNRAVTPIAELDGDPGANPASYDGLARRTRRTRSNLARLDPPEDARDELDALVRSLGDVTQDLEAVARTTRAKDPVLQKRAARRLEHSNERFRRAENALHRAVEG
jgi:hypothetical protein